MRTDSEFGLDMAVPWSCIGRPATTARDRLLNTATELFCHNGFTATGVDIIVQRSGAAKSTLYSHFKS
jgi:AcrR family transcriptional regulator